MSGRLLVVLGTIFWLGACASIDDAGRAYFRQGRKVKGVEPADALIERMNNERELREIMYGQLKSSRVVQCTLLRNQLYVAAMKGSSSQEIASAVKLMETAYQESDAAFLAACDQVMSMNVGKVFVAIQHEYLRKEK